MFWPQKISLRDILVNSLGSLTAGIIGSIIILFLVFITSWIIDIPAWFNSMKVWAKTTPIFPILLSVIALIGTFWTMFLTYFILSMTNPEKYKKSLVIYGQIAFFTVLVYLFVTPVYIYEWLKNYEFIIYIFLFHVLILSFWISLLTELLNNYRYVLTWVYWSFIWLFISTIVALSIFSFFPSWYAKLVSLVVLLPIINFLMTFFKQLFELVYFYYYKYTALDSIWDIFYSIEQEEKEKLREEEEKNMI